MPPLDEETHEVTLPLSSLASCLEGYYTHIVKVSLKTTRHKGIIIVIKPIPEYLIFTGTVFNACMSSERVIHWLNL